MFWCVFFLFLIFVNVWAFWGSIFFMTYVVVFENFVFLGCLPLKRILRFFDF